MAILGYGGKLRLRREYPRPAVVLGTDVNVASSTFIISDPGFWTGDLVVLRSERGLPIDTGSDGPDCPDGYAVYGESIWQLGTNRPNDLTEDIAFYKSDNEATFYMRSDNCGLTTEATYYINRDQLDRVSLYTSQAGALNGQISDRVPLYRVDSGEITVVPGGEINYENSSAFCVNNYGAYNNSDVEIAETGLSLCSLTPGSTPPVPGIDDYENADFGPLNALGQETPWLIQGLLREWTLNLSAPEVDTTAVGERFGDSVKSLVTGGGTMDFLVDRFNRADNADATLLMRLLLLTEKGCASDAEFWMIEDRDQSGTLLPGDLYYQTRLMVTSVAINTRADDVIAGSLNFVTIGEISLRMGMN